MNKRGLNQVITTGLLILLGIAGIVIIWGFARAFFVDTGERVNIDVIGTSFSIDQSKVTIDEGINLVSFVLKREAGEANVEELKIVLEDDAGNSIVFNQSALNELESKKINLSFANTSLGDLAKIEVVPVLDKNEKESFGRIEGFELKGNYNYPNELVAYWSFDEGSGSVARDLSGNGNDGNLINGASWTAGKVGGAVDFDGINNYISVDNAEVFDSGEWSVTAWVKIGSGNFQTLLSLNQSNPQSFPLVRAYHVSQNAPLLYLNNTYYAYGGSDIRDDQWHHIAYLFRDNDKYLRVYLDGTDKTFYWALVDDAYKVGSRWYIGSTTGGAFLNGTIDELRIYKRVLNAEEIKELSEQGN